MSRYHIKEVTLEGEECYCVYYNGLLYKEIAYFKEERYTQMFLKALEIGDLASE